MQGVSWIYSFVGLIYKILQFSVPAISHEDIVFMKQIEHDSLFTYDVSYFLCYCPFYTYFLQELHLFRETIFRNYINQLNKNISTDDGEPEVFELISPDSPGNLFLTN